MLFTWSTKNLCIVFEGWRVTGNLSLIFSLLAIVALSAGYEAVRELSRRYEADVAKSKDANRKSSLHPSLYTLSALSTAVLLYTSRLSTRLRSGS